MGKQLRLVAVCALAFGMVTGGVLLSVASAGAPIRVDLTPGSTTFLDLDGDGRIDRGDRFTGRQRLVDPATDERIGRASSECIAMTRIVVEESRGTWVCTYVLELPEGHILLQGKDPAGLGPYVLAVTGGTAPYRNARGEADLVDVGFDLTEITIHLEP